jgi:hypothetical protein
MRGSWVGSTMRCFLTMMRWGVALILASWGIYMTIGFLADKFDGGPAEPMWFDLLFFAFIGLVPLAGGLMLIFLPRRKDVPPKLTKVENG